LPLENDRPEPGSARVEQGNDTSQAAANDRHVEGIVISFHEPIQGSGWLKRHYA
jgi:hypothetical protein